MALLSTLLSFTYLPPPSVLVDVITVASVVAIPFLGLSEVRGVHLQYSNFWNFNAHNKYFKTVSGRTGMVVLYLPAILAGVVPPGMFPDTGLKFFVLVLALTVHFLKRVLENIFPKPSIDLTYPGVALFLIGIGGYFYHYLLMSRLRMKGEKEYKIPSGGLFDSVICPHYLFEIIDFVGIAFIFQTIYSFVVALNTIGLLRY